jgi:hypothetical protein
MKILGVARMIDNPRAVCVLLKDAPTDGDLRRLHDVLRANQPPPYCCSCGSPRCVFDAQWGNNAHNALLTGGRRPC